MTVACRDGGNNRDEPRAGTYRLVSVAGQKPPALEWRGPPRFLFVDSGAIELLPNHRYQSVLAIRESTVDQPIVSRVSRASGTFSVTGDRNLRRADAAHRWLILSGSNGSKSRYTFSDSGLQYLSSLNRRLDYQLVP